MPPFYEKLNYISLHVNVFCFSDVDELKIYYKHQFQFITVCR